jgi:hypothetical protein
MLKSSLITALLAFSGLMAQAQTMPTTPTTPAAPAKAGTGSAPASTAKPAAPTPAAQAPAASAPEVKKSKAGICHDQTSPGYKQLKKFTEFKSMDECIKSGGHAPKAAKK